MENQTDNPDKEFDTCSMCIFQNPKKATSTLDGQNPYLYNKTRNIFNLSLLTQFHSNSESSVLNFFLNSTMELSQSLRFQQLELPFCPQQLQQPQKPTFSVRRTSQVIVAAAKTKRRPPIEGVSEELNLIADQSLDFAPARRRVRSAFVELQQQLDHCLFKLAPTGIRTEEWYEINSRGIGIFCKSWKPREGVPIKGVLCFCHGYGDTCVFFFEGIAKQIAAAGYAVYAMDYPGFGLSEGLHGFIPSFDQLADDVIEQYTKIKAKPELKGLPHFILGQSMGGAVTLKVHFKQPYAWDGIVLVAPMCKIAEDVTPPPAAQKILTLMSRVVPKAKLVPQKDLAELAFRDERKRKLAVYNVTCYNGPVRLKTAVELLNATKEIEMQVDKVSSPLLILHGAADKVTDPLVSQFLYEKASSKDKSLKLYPDGFHCILEGEPDDRIFSVLEDIITWLDHRCLLK